MKTLSILILTLGSFANADTVEMETGGFRIRAPQLQYYYETRQEAVIRYTNPFLSDGAKVEIELALPKREVNDDGETPPEFHRYEMKYQGNDTWAHRLETLRHGLGANWMIGEVLFVFHVTPPGKKTVKIECEDHFKGKGIYSGSFNRIRELPWRTANEPIVLHPAEVECETE